MYYGHSFVDTASTAIFVLITHLDTTGIRYLVDVTTVDVTAASYRLAASQEAGAAARKAEARKTREYRSKVDGWKP